MIPSNSKKVSLPTSGLAVDIDDTLALTTMYWIAELTRLFGNETGMSPQEIMALYHQGGYEINWQTEDALNWKEYARHSNEVQLELALVEEADTYLTKINQVTPITAYLTSRPESVRVGTLQWLKKHSFPEAELIMRPVSVPYQEGTSWKADMLVKLYPRISAIIDDHPMTIQKLPVNYKGTIFLYTHKTAPETPCKVIPCPTWADVYTKVSEVFGR